MKNYIVVSTCDRLVRQVTLAILSMTDTGKIVVVGNEKTRDLRWTSFCAENQIVSFNQRDDREFVKKIHALREAMPEAVLIPTDCDAVRTVIRVRDELKVRTTRIPDSAILETLDNKWHFYEFCAANGITVPETMYIGAKINLNFTNIANRLGAPFILKPVNQAGSMGVHLIRSEDHLNEVILNNDSYRFDTLIAQQYIAGTDLCFNLMADHGEITACSIQQRIGPKIRFLPNPELESLGHQLARASAYNGPMCIDARVEDETNKVYLIESNPRFWASLCASVWCGLNFVSEAIEASSSPANPHRLISGSYYERHPLYRPFSWGALMLDRSKHGRMFRTMMCDLPTLSELTCNLPAALWNFLARRLQPG